jgi:RimJ/RimL family protein N-acetyltransferase
MPGATFLHGERVSLRPVETDDASFLQRAVNEPELRVPLGGSRPANEAQVTDSIENRTESDDCVDLLVCLDEPIGNVRLERLSRARSILSYWIAPEHQGEGYATEATSLVIDYVFTSFDKPGIRAFTSGENEPSRRLLETLGFRQEGRFRKDQFREGEYVDTVHYGLLREEWTDE